MQLTIDSIVEHRGRWMRNNFDNLEKWRNFLASSFKWWLPRDIHNLSRYKETNAIYSFYSISDCQLFLKLRVVNVYRERANYCYCNAKWLHNVFTKVLFLFPRDDNFFSSTIDLWRSANLSQSFVWKISMKFSLSLTVIAPERERVEEGRNGHKFKFSSCFARKESALWENSWHECKKSFEYDLFSEESGSSSTLSLIFFSERHKKCFISERENFLDLSNVPVDTMCILCHSLIPI